MLRVVALLSLCSQYYIVSGEILTPPYFNLAFGKKVTATATCGDEGPELYCKLVGANADNDEHVIQGQVCDICDANNETKKHPPENAVDGTETWWQSPPLSRGMKYNEVNLTIDLGQEFHVAYVFVRMGNSPRPGLWALEKSTDYGKTYKPWQYFSDSPQDCERYFGKESLLPITKDDSVICSTEYSKIVPLEGGEIPIPLLNYRPSANKYFNSSVLQEWTRATNVRLRLLRTKNLLGHLMSVARQDPTVTRRYFYSIKDISIGGRCMCNGHADTCAPDDPTDDSSILACNCQHNTCGSQCTECCPGFEQKKWRISQNWDRFACEPCNCHNHSTECVFDPKIDEQRLSLDIHGRHEGGGVCQNCQHNTQGINCNKCQPTFYRPAGKRWDEIDVCHSCNCNLHFSTGNCQEESGICECRPEFNPPLCDSCAYGYFDFPDCKPCTCNQNGTEGGYCTPQQGLCPCKYNYAGRSCEICADGYYSPQCKNCECNAVGSGSHVCDKETGNCTCKSKYSGRTCNQCEPGYYNYPTCSHCNCDISGTLPNICDDVTGECICKTGFGGLRCDQCIAGYYMEVKGRERTCVPCDCFPTGSTSTTSCSADGKCNCLANFGGKQCNKCSPGYYQFPECLPCNCDVSGSIGSTCDDNGMCVCKPNFDRSKCDRCKEQFYNYPACEECNCDPRGVIATFAGCGSVPAGELCQCKDRVQGRICNDCKPLFWNLQDYNPLGCEECGCHLAGTLGGLGACNTKTGQCKCKLHVNEKQCDQCQDGFYKLETLNVFGCTECECDIGGSIDNVCDKRTGQCRCHARVEGRRCDRPIRTRYYPTLHQHQYELEEGSTHSGPVRYRSDEHVFPGYSWRGYVVFSSLQNEVINIVQISKSSFYRMVVRYVNPLRDPVVATIVINPESVGDIQQKFSVLFKATAEPQFVTVAGEKGNSPSPLVMNPGNWTVNIKTTKEVMIDYFVLIPEAYYEATILTKQVDKPCAVGDERLCRHFVYPSVSAYPVTDVSNLITAATEYINDTEQLYELGVGSTDIPLLSNEQSELQYKMIIPIPGSYVFVIEYVTPINRTSGDDITNEVDDDIEYITKGMLTLRFQSSDGSESNAIVNLNDCPYTSPCRQVMVDDLSKIYIVNVQEANNVLYLEAEQDTLAGIKSIIAIPESQWHLDYLTPRAYCLRRDRACAPAIFAAAVDSKKVEVETGNGGIRDTRPNILDNSTVVVYIGPNGDHLKLDSKVPTPGIYKLLVHYMQPDHPESSINVVLSAESQQMMTSMSVEHCPSVSGCRSVLKQADGNTDLLIRDNFTLLFKGEGSKGVWLDYVLIIAQADFVDSTLKEANMLDYTQEFIEKCAKNNYYISPNASDFCRESVFSITTEYNSGTLNCYCDLNGSTELECDTFGGQCHCLPNVIGKTCSTCRTGYYGFPNCKPCRCPSTAICDDDGQCICPKNVEGENCDRCKPYTFNFDVQRGCDDCNCNSLGVIGNQLQCEADNGNCACKENVIGRVCDRCVPGHYAFPECVRCSCELAGSTEDVCDQNTSQCYCKKHVRGQACDTCKEEYYNIQTDNPDGCTKCYCFGKTTRCSGSYMSWANINVMTDWYLVNIVENRTLNIFPYPEKPSVLNESVIGAHLASEKNDQQHTVYFGAPNYYLGKRLNSYGGKLTYSILYVTRNESGHAVAAPDVILGGPNSHVIHNSVEQPPSLLEWQHSVRLTEEEFTNLDGSPLTRDQFMNLLVNVTSIYIRATYWHEAVSTRLIDVSMDLAVEDYIESDLRASSVEECLCPKAYRGLSCEQCAEGHYRLSSGPHAGFCVPCQCNGHSNHCDVNTGICLNCADNTMGDHCEQCIIGYHGDATVGTPRDCLICACPLPYSSNNFAIGCQLSENGSLISCDCKEGYIGPRCEYCAAGYYGNPETVGDYCKPCNCSGNINVEDPGSCDTITGDCLKCVNNTAGAACNLCAPGFYGDAIVFKNCAPCDCDEYGMEYCDHDTGGCVCRPGVEGARCDRCAPARFGLASGRGCDACDCALAALSPHCDLATGQCQCAKGVTGRHCEQCAAGYWNYTKDGCDHCNCNTDISVGFTCNATGQCECLRGAIGEKCDRCPERWILIPHEGCLECDSCTDALIFSVQDMCDLLSNETQEFKDKADSFFTTQRLNYIAKQAEELRPRVSLLRNVDLANVTNSVTTLETSAKNLLRSAEFAATDSENQIRNAATLSGDAEKCLVAVSAGGRGARDAVAQVARLATGLELSQLPKVDSALAEAHQIKNDIIAKDLAPKNQIALGALVNATVQQELMKVFVQPVNEQAKKFGTLLEGTAHLKEKRDNMLEFIELAQRKADEAAKLNGNNKNSKFSDKVLSVTSLNVAAMNDLIDAAWNINNITYINLKGRELTANATTALEGATDAKGLMEQRIASFERDLPELHNLTDVVSQHATALRSRADNLRALAERENNNSRTRDAYSAASAYTSIVQEIGDAKLVADLSADAVANATNVNNLLKEKVGPALNRSQNLVKLALTALNTVEKNLSPNLTTADKAVSNARSTLSAADDEDHAIQLSLPSAPKTNLESEIQKAEQVNATLKTTVDIMSSLGNELEASKVWAQGLPKLADSAQKMTSNVRSMVTDKVKFEPLIQEYNKVKTKQDDFEHRSKDANDKLQKLKDVIEQVRNVANRIQVGVTFDRLSTLQPRLPDTVDEMSTSTHVSAYFRTNEKDGFLLYLGNPKGTMLRRTRSDDFMVLGIQNGYPYLLMDIGDSGDTGRDPARITSDKMVADNKWYQVVVDRMGRNVKLTIRESLDNGTEAAQVKEAVLPGQHTIFNLDKQKSKLYVGGVPSGVVLQGIKFQAFEGQIEELKIGETPVGLWNFVNSANLKGARQRNKLLPPTTPPPEIRFNGRSHVTVSGRGFLTAQQNNLLLFFKTYAPNGLVYLVGEQESFFSVQLQNGSVYLQVSLGNTENLLILGTAKKYNDGKWHKLDVRRYTKSCSLKVDNEVVKGTSTSSTDHIDAVETMNFGGNNKGIEQITSEGFDGCFRLVSVDGVNIDLSENVEESVGIAYGCLFSSLVSLSGEDSYLRFVDITSENLQLTLKFKTDKPDGLLFVYFSRTQTSTMQDSISLSLIKGKLVLMSQREQLDMSMSTYNDSQWHVVTVLHTTSALGLVVDDYDRVTSDAAPSPLYILEGVLFVGGVQPGYVVGGKVGTKTAFRGCIADLAVNGRVLNLLEPYNNNSVTFGRCGTTTSTGGAHPDESSWVAGHAGAPDVLPTLAPPPPPAPTTQTPVFNHGNNEVVNSQSTTSTVPPVSVTERVTAAAGHASGSVGHVSSPFVHREPALPEPGCALAFDPTYEIGDPSEGYRFGTRNDSRIEYAKLPGRQLDGFDLTVTLRTADAHGGLIFYAAAERAAGQFLALHMRNGQIHVEFNCGGETGSLSSSATFNESAWHTLTLVRNGGHAKLSVDNEHIAETSVRCVAPAVLAPPFYYGGLRDHTENITRNLKTPYQPFVGCLKGLMMNGQYATDIRHQVNALRCTDNIEQGVYFGPSKNTHSNYLKLLNNFRIGIEISISMEIKPRNSTGLLMSVHGKNDYMVLEMLENEVFANVENGKGPFHASYKLGDKFSLCDGKWHKIHAVKSRHVVSVGVDGNFSDAGLGHSASTDTRSSLYIGGHEKRLDKVRGVKSLRGFTGCIRNIMIRENPVPIPLTAAGRDTHIGVCPTD